MSVVHVNAPNGSYDIYIGSGILKQWQPPASYAVVTDENVHGLYGDKFPEDRYCAILAPGEESKTMSKLTAILNSMVEMDLDRKSTLIAFGGGVVGDIGGFAASVYKRGIAYIQIPTTLLAQVDSSVGGKVAVDLPGGKNLAGAFHQPSLVVADTDTLKTLPEREYAAGMAEVIKYGYIADEKLHDHLVSQDISVEDIVGTCCRIKARYVELDPLDHGIRAQLNYGHTIGHAIENAAGYETYLHGEAVAVGMVYASAIGEKLGVSPPGLRQDCESLLESYDLPIDVPHDILHRALGVLSRDKKATNGTIDFVLIDRIGHAVLHPLPVPELVKMMEELL